MKINRFHLCLIVTIATLNVSCSEPSALMFSTRATHFSSPEKFDTFILVGTGNDTLSSPMVFLIISSNGDTLWRDSFQSMDLIGYGLISTERNNITDEQKRAYIAHRIRTFFDDREYFHPAIAENDTNASFSPDESVWEAIRNDSASVGFHYLIGEENNRNIAFCTSLRRVVVYSSFD